MAFEEGLCVIYGSYRTDQIEEKLRLVIGRDCRMRVLLGSKFACVALALGMSTEQRCIYSMSLDIIELNIDAIISSSPPFNAPFFDEPQTQEGPEIIMCHHTVFFLSKCASEAAHCGARRIV